MNKNIYLTILTIITVACIIIGSIFHLGLFHISDLGNKKIIGSGKSNDTIAVGTFNNISVDCEVMDLTMEEGAAYEVSYNCSEKMIPTVSVDGDTLVIKQKNNNKGLFNKGYKCSLSITVPKTTALKDVTVEQSVGDIKLNNISADDFNLSLNVGDIKLTGASAKTVKAESNTGDVKFDDCKLDEINVESNVGDVVFDDSCKLTDYSMTLSTDIGEVKVFGNDHGKSFSQNGSAGQLKVETNIGDVKLN